MAGAHSHGGDDGTHEPCVGVLRACRDGAYEVALKFVDGSAGRAAGGRLAARYAALRAELLARAGRNGEALEAAEAALAADPGIGDAWLVKGDMLEEAGDHRGAVGCYAEAERQGHWAGEAALRIREAVAMANAHMHDESEAEAAAAQGLDPGNADTAARRADILRHTGKDGDALRAINDGIAASPDSGALHSYRATLLADMGEHAGALEAAVRANGLSPGITYAWYTKARALARLGRADEAIDALAVAVMLDPSNVKDARKEEDFGPVRGTDGWRRLVGGPAGGSAAGRSKLAKA